MPLSPPTIRARLPILAYINWALIIISAFIATTPQTWPLYESNQLLLVVIAITSLLAFLSATILTLESSFPFTTCLWAGGTLLLLIRTFAQLVLEITECAKYTSDAQAKRAKCEDDWAKDTAPSTAHTICMSTIKINTAHLPSGKPRIHMSRLFTHTGTCPSVATSIFEFLFVAAFTATTLYTIMLAYPLYTHYLAKKTNA